MKLNLPNKLTLIRLAAVPVFMLVMALPDIVGSDNGSVFTLIMAALSAALFIGASVTDMLDGKIARRQNLITDFGKFLDPLADKFMVIGAMLMIIWCGRYANVRPVFFWAVVIVIFREFAVTAIRLVAMSSGGKVIAANILGKIKTVTQIVCVCSVIIEPILAGFSFWQKVPVMKYWITYLPISYASIVVMTVFTVWSGINYIRGAWSIINPNK